jgi:hypothetical protein
MTFGPLLTLADIDAIARDEGRLAGHHSTLTRKKTS